MAADPLESISCSSQPLSISFHPTHDIVAAGLVGGNVEIHDFSFIWAERGKDTIQPLGASPTLDNASDIDVANDFSDSDSDSSGGENDCCSGGSDCSKSSDRSNSLSSSTNRNKATDRRSKTLLSSMPLHYKSCRAVLFSHGNGLKSSSNLNKPHLYSAGGDAALCCLDVERATNGTKSQSPQDCETRRKVTAASLPSVLWKIENAHPSGINRMYQFPSSHSSFEEKDAGHDAAEGDSKSRCPTLLATGDDDGIVRLWDIRLCCSGSGSCSGGSLPRGCVANWRCHTDYISDFDTDASGHTLLVTSGDCTLSVLDVRKGLRYTEQINSAAESSSKKRRRNRKKIEQQNDQDDDANKVSDALQGLKGKSDDIEDELLCISVLKNGSKVICGTQLGTLPIWSWGAWGDYSDCVKNRGRGQAVDVILKVDEDTIITGSSDGLLRVVQVHPNKLLGILGHHEDNFPVEDLRFGRDRRVVGSTSHDDLIRLWDASILLDDDDLIEEVNNAENESGCVEISVIEGDALGGKTCDQNNCNSKNTLVKTLGRGMVTWGKTAGREDDLEDEDSDEDSNSDTGDDDIYNRSRKKKSIGIGKMNNLRTENEKFFADL